MLSFISIGSAVSAPQGVEIHQWRMALTTVLRTNVLHCEKITAYLSVINPYLQNLIYLILLREIAKEINLTRSACNS